MIALARRLKGLTLSADGDGMPDGYSSQTNVDRIGMCVRRHLVRLHLGYGKLSATYVNAHGGTEVLFFVMPLVVRCFD